MPHCLLLLCYGEIAPFLSGAYNANTRDCLGAVFQYVRLFFLSLLKFLIITCHRLLLIFIKLLYFKIQLSSDIGNITCDVTLYTPHSSCLPSCGVLRKGFIVALWCMYAPNGRLLTSSLSFIE